jgi:integrase/recombinase XerD
LIRRRKSAAAGIRPRTVRTWIDITTIGQWLGHESVETTQVYLDADLERMEKSLAKVQEFAGKPRRFRPDDSLLAFLGSL